MLFGKLVRAVHLKYLSYMFEHWMISVIKDAKDLKKGTILYSGNDLLIEDIARPHSIYHSYAISWKGTTVFVGVLHEPNYAHFVHECYLHVQEFHAGIWWLSELEKTYKSLRDASHEYEAAKYLQKFAPLSEDVDTCEEKPSITSKPSKLFNPASEVRAAADYAKEFGADRVIIFSTKNGSDEYTYASYGDTDIKCEQAKLVAKGLFKLVGRKLAETILT